MSEKLTRQGRYPGEFLSGKDSNKRYKWDGLPPRPVSKGEYYLSGAIITAYRAMRDLNTPHYIALEAGVLDKCPHCNGTGKMVRS